VLLPSNEIVLNKTIVNVYRAFKEDFVALVNGVEPFWRCKGITEEYIDTINNG